jgi:hypothetical protein
VNLAPDDPRHGTTNGYCNLECRCQPCRDAWAIECAGRRSRRAAALAPDDPRHGQPSTYNNHGCRCDKCRAANTADVRRHRTENGPPPPGDKRHGTVYGYNLKCRCDLCRKAASDYARNKRLPSRVAHLVDLIHPEPQGSVIESADGRRFFIAELAS